MDDLSAWIAFSQLRSLTLQQKHTLLQSHQHPDFIFELDPRALKLNVQTSKSRIGDDIDQRQLDITLNWLNQSCQHNIIHVAQQRFPPLLKEIPCAPLLLYTIGDSTLLTHPQIAIVGSRKATIAGQQMARQFAADLGLCGLVITSGMALGIDTSAHEGALKHECKTIAVLGTGVNLCYPKSNNRLYDLIAKNGLIVSEFNLDSPPKKEHFPRRNRIISGLSLGVLVVEAAQRSGSLITANFAVQQNREVFAIPGSIHAPNACGCLNLIQQGAKLTRSAQDVLDEFREFSAQRPNNTTQSQAPLDNSESKPVKQLLALITDAPVSFDKLISQSGLTIDQLCSMLLDLQMHGKIEKLPGNQFIRTAN